MSLLRILGLASLLAFAAGSAEASNFQILHVFCSEANCVDGSRPSKPVLDAAGNLLVGALGGGANGQGGVIAFSPEESGWREHFIHSFCKGGDCQHDGERLYGGLSADGAGNFYGSTEDGGNKRRKGIVFQLTPDGKGSYKFHLLYEFCSLARCADGKEGDGHIVADTAGNVYGTALGGGLGGGGVVYELSPPAAGSHRWTQKVLYNFCNRSPDCGEGRDPLSGLTYAGETDGLRYDGVSPLYGSTREGGAHHEHGVIFRLAPQGDGSWSQTVLYSFCAETACRDGEEPANYGPLVVDKHSNIFGATTGGGRWGSIGDGGTLFALKPHGDTWRLTTLFDFCGDFDVCRDANGSLPTANPVMDAKGNLYGTTVLSGGFGGNTLYKFDRKTSALEVLYSFCTSDCAEGVSPEGGVILDKAGNIFGAMSQENGSDSSVGGSLWELTP